MTSLALIDDPAAAARSSEPAVLRRCGEYWSVAFHDDAFLVRDTKGLRYLAHLLSQPWVDVHALDLLGASGGRPAPAGMRCPEQDGLPPATGDGVEILDAPARAGYRRRLDELSTELERARAFADPDRAARAREELAFIAAELERCLGLGGRARLTVSAAERARQSVTKAIKAAQRRIASHSPALAGHLQQSVSTGTYCAYMPAPSATVGWRL